MVERKYVDDLKYFAITVLLFYFLFNFIKHDLHKNVNCKVDIYWPLKYC